MKNNTLINLEKETVNSIIREKNIYKSLELSKILGSIKQNRNNGNYDLIDLEKELISRLKSLLFPESIKVAKLKGSRDILHVITQYRSSGGHSRLCDRLGSFDEGGSDLFICQSSEKYKSNNSKMHTDFSFNRVLYSSNEYGSLAYFYEVMKIFGEYKIIVLHIDPNDINTVALLGVLKSICNVIIYFVNHSDHTFCYGESIIDVKLEISYRGYLLNKLRGGIYQSSYIGLPLKTDSLNSNRYNSITGCTNFVMAGAPWKIKPFKGQKVNGIIETILKYSSENTVTIIGPNLRTNYWLWVLKAKYIRRLRIYSRLDYEEYLKLLEDSEVAVDTHPVPGGFALVEMFISGLIPCGIRTGIVGFSATDAVKVSETDDIFKTTVTQELKELTHQLHSYDSVKERYILSLGATYSEIPRELIITGKPDLDFFREKGKAKLNIYDLDMIRTTSKQSRKNLIKSYLRNIDILSAPYVILKQLIKSRNK
ncbi:hypothetical protein [Vibrio breoganii]|uniref:hypothetical protein n=1 Tax=Vibrio breoganii TaxID=553239 RepID=UPI000C829F9F|nr:hypothetical protein [Vibrio breoganii]PML99983.1 hypothetical protein BCT64_18315 [Vibrio breoganii]PMN70143.1 hypothetical protein BCT28_18020 [Vibrio breoganii]